MEPHGTKHGRAPRAALYRAPATLAFFIVSLVLSLPGEQGLSALILHIEEPTLKSFLTSHLFHTSGLHLLLNILVILPAGSILELRWGTPRFVAFYLFCAWGTAAASILIGALFNVAGPACGASGVALGSLVAVGLLYPDHRLVRAAPPAKHFVWILIFLGSTGLAVMDSGDSETQGHSVLLPQVSGVAFALLFLGLDPWCRRLAEKWREVRARGRRKRVGEIRLRVDELLEKISAHGYDSLTRDEKAFLQRASKHFRSS